MVGRRKRIEKSRCSYLARIVVTVEVPGVYAPEEEAKKRIYYFASSAKTLVGEPLRHRVQADPRRSKVISPQWFYRCGVAPEALDAVGVFFHLQPIGKGAISYQHEEKRFLK